MFNVFKGALLALVREKSVFIWSLAFPLILSTMFVFMFANLDEAGQFEPILSLIHISEPTRQAEISYAVFCFKKKKQGTALSCSST